jgi:hypothetical protein
LLPYWHDHYAIEDTGKTYKNYYLNFQITRPHQSWSFDKNLTNYEQASGITSPDPNILGGIVVESPIRLEGFPDVPVRLVVVLVYHENNDGTTEPNYIAQHQMKEFQTAFYNTTVDIIPSVNGDDVNVRAIGEKYSQFFYWNEHIHKNNDKVYLLTQIWSSNPLYRRKILRILMTHSNRLVHYRN